MQRAENRSGSQNNDCHANRCPGAGFLRKSFAVIPSGSAQAVAISATEMLLCPQVCISDPNVDVIRPMRGNIGWLSG
jgi:hypothetical protein